MDEDETWDQAAYREMNEEIGILTDIRVVGDFKLSVDRDGKKIRQFNRFYEGTIDSLTKLTVQQEDMSEIKWYELDELKSQMQKTPEIFTPGFHESITKFY